MYDVSKSELNRILILRIMNVRAGKIVRKSIVRMRSFENVFEKLQMFENKLQSFEITPGGPPEG